MRRLYEPEEYRDGTVRRMRTSIESARSFLDSVEAAIESGGDVAQSAEALGTTADRILGLASELRALDSVRWSAPKKEGL